MRRVAGRAILIDNITTMLRNRTTTSGPMTRCTEIRWKFCQAAFIRARMRVMTIEATFRRCLMHPRRGEFLRIVTREAKLIASGLQ